MKTRILIGCASKHSLEATQAFRFYTGAEFQLPYAYAKTTHKIIFILSGKYGVVQPWEILKPYSCNLNDQTKEYRKEWAVQVATSLRRHGCNLKEDQFVIFAGKAYREYLTQYLKNCIAPFQNLRTGFQKNFCKKWAAEKFPIESVKVIEGAQYKMRGARIKELVDQFMTPAKKSAEAGFQLDITSYVLPILCGEFEVDTNKKQLVRNLEKRIEKQVQVAIRNFNASQSSVQKVS